MQSKCSSIAPACEPRSTNDRLTRINTRDFAHAAINRTRRSRCARHAVLSDWHFSGRQECRVGQCGTRSTRQWRSSNGVRGTNSAGVENGAQCCRNGDHGAYGGTEDLNTEATENTEAAVGPAFGRHSDRDEAAITSAPSMLLAFVIVASSRSEPRVARPTAAHKAFLCVLCDLCVQ